MTSTLNLGDVYICSFPFTSGQLSKPRPVLVLFDLDEDCLIARITSVLHTGPLDVSLTQWHAAGLEKPSVVRLTRLVTAEKTLLKLTIGELSAVVHHLSFHFFEFNRARSLACRRICSSSAP